MFKTLETMTPPAAAAPGPLLPKHMETKKNMQALNALCTLLDFCPENQILAIAIPTISMCSKGVWSRAGAGGLASLWLWGGSIRLGVASGWDGRYFGSLTQHAPHSFFP